MKGLTKAQKHHDNTKKLPIPPENCNGLLYTVNKGDSLFIISRKQKVTLKSIIKANPQIEDPDKIYEGQILCIPKFGVKVNSKFQEVVLDPTPEATLARGIAFIRKDTNDILIAASNLPNPGVLFPNADTYSAYLLDEATGNYEKVHLNFKNDLWIGQAFNKPLRQYDSIVVAPNISSGSLLPGEPIVLEGQIKKC